MDLSVPQSSFGQISNSLEALDNVSRIFRGYSSANDC